MPYSLRFAVPPPAQDQQGRAGTGQQPGNPAPQTTTETIYVTMSTTDPQHSVRWNRRDIVNMAVRFLAVALLLLFVLVPDMPVYTVRTLTVPVVLLPAQTITVRVPIMATGLQTYPATQSHGTLTITNGGSLSEFIPAGFLLTASSGVEVATDQGVTIPPGNGASYGMATVSAHAIVAGTGGNIPADSVNRTYGTDLFIKNATAFTGGKDASAMHFVTERDTQTALAHAHAQIEAKRPLGLLLKPCTETTSQQADQVSIALRCQPITYHVPPGVQVVSVRVQGARVIVAYKALLYTNA